MLLPLITERMINVAKKMKFTFSETIYLGREEKPDTLLEINSPERLGIEQMNREKEVALVRIEETQNNRKFNLALFAVTLIEWLLIVGAVSEKNVLALKNIRELRFLYLEGRLPETHPFFVFFSGNEVLQAFYKDKYALLQEMKKELKIHRNLKEQTILKLAERKNIQVYRDYRAKKEEKDAHLKYLAELAEPMNLNGSKSLLFAVMYLAVMESQMASVKAARRRNKEKEEQLVDYNFRYVHNLFNFFPFQAHEFMQLTKELPGMNKAPHTVKFGLNQEGEASPEQIAALKALQGEQVTFIDGKLAGLDMWVDLEDVLEKSYAINGTAYSFFTIGRMVGVLESVSVSKKGFVVIVVKDLRSEDNQPVTPPIEPVAEEPADAPSEGHPAYMKEEPPMTTQEEQNHMEALLPASEGFMSTEPNVAAIDRTEVQTKEEEIIMEKQIIIQEELDTAAILELKERVMEEVVNRQEEEAVAREMVAARKVAVRSTVKPVVVSDGKVSSNREAVAARRALLNCLLVVRPSFQSGHPITMRALSELLKPFRSVRFLEIKGKKGMFFRFVQVKPYYGVQPVTFVIIHKDGALLSVRMTDAQSFTQAQKEIAQLKNSQSAAHYRAQAIRVYEVFTGQVVRNVKAGK